MTIKDEKLLPCPQQDKNRAEMCWQDAVAFAAIVPKWSPLFKKWIEGTPLENDIPIWMAEYALKMRDAAVRHHARTIQPSEGEAERVARAMCVADNEAQPIGYQPGHDVLWKEDSGVYIAMAKAAIAALTPRGGEVMEVFDGGYISRGTPASPVAAVDPTMPTMTREELVELISEAATHRGALGPVTNLGSLDAWNIHCALIAKFPHLLTPEPLVKVGGES